jgi:hypothetical protein
MLNVLGEFQKIVNSGNIRDSEHLKFGVPQRRLLKAHLLLVRIFLILLKILSAAYSRLIFD